MRLLSLNTVSLLIVTVTVSLLVGVAALRHRVIGAVSPEAFEIDYAAVAERRPDDPKAWLAFLATSFNDADTTRAYARSAELAPTDPAPHVIFALSAMRDLPMIREEYNAFVAGTEIQERPLTKEEREASRRAADALAKAATLDPENAAIDWLRIRLALAEHEDTHALDLMRDALTKSTWNTYEREAGIAIHETARPLLPPLEASFVGVLGTPPGSRSDLRHLVYMILGMSLLAEEHGDHAEAVFLRESVLHQGRLMMQDGYTLLEALVGSGIWSMAARKGLTEEERAAVTDGVSDPGSGSALSEAEIAAGRAKLAAYFREHGRGDLADELLSFADAQREWRGRVRTGWELTFGPIDSVLVLSLALEQTVHGAAWTLVALVLSALVALMLWLLRRPARPVSWPLLAWVAVVLVCIGLTYAAGLLGIGGDTLWVWSPIADFEASDETLPAWGDYFAVVSLPLISLATLLIVLLLRRRGSEAKREGAIRQYVGTLTCLLLPLAALTCLVALGVAVATAVHAAEVAEVERAEIYQGRLVRDVGFEYP